MRDIRMSSSPLHWNDMARKNLKILLALAPLGLNGAASAADLGSPFIKAPAAIPYYSWAGYYIGANLGYGVGQGDGSISYGGAGGVTPGLFSFNSQPAGVIAGGQAG